MSENYLIHFGNKNSGRYPRGSGERPHQHDGLYKPLMPRRSHLVNKQRVTALHDKELKSLDMKAENDLYRAKQARKKLGKNFVSRFINQFKDTPLSRDYKEKHKQYVKDVTKLTERMIFREDQKRLIKSAEDRIKQFENNIKKSEENAQKAKELGEPYYESDHKKILKDERSRGSIKQVNDVLKKLKSAKTNEDLKEIREKYGYTITLSDGQVASFPTGWL